MNDIVERTEQRIKMSRLVMAMVTGPLVAGVIYYLLTWSAPILEGRIQEHIEYLSKFGKPPLDQIAGYTVLFFFVINIFGIPAFFLFNKVKKNGLVFFLAFWAVFGFAVGVVFSGLIWPIDENATFRDTYWVVYSVPVALVGGALAFWLVGVEYRFGKEV